MPKEKVLLGAVPTEDEEQIKLAVWLTKQNIKFFAVPNGGKRNLFEAMKLKRMGVQSGVPDIFIPVANKTQHGLFIELKRIRGGQVARNQWEWITYLKEAGYEAAIAYGCEDAKRIVGEYLSFGRPSI